MIISETKRLILREFQEEDAKDLYILNSVPEVLKYTGDPPFVNEEDALLFVQNYEQYQKHGMGRWALIRKKNNEFIGWCGLKYHESTNEVDLGFRIRKEDWNQGYATEASNACLEYGFEKLKLNKIIGRAMEENKASIRVLEKIGMFDPVKKEFDQHPGLQFSIDKNEYNRRRKIS